VKGRKSKTDEVEDQT